MLTVLGASLFLAIIGEKEERSSSEGATKALLEVFNISRDKNIYRYQVVFRISASFINYVALEREWHSFEDELEVRSGQMIGEILFESLPEIKNKRHFQIYTDLVESEPVAWLGIEIWTDGMWPSVRSASEACGHFAGDLGCVEPIEFMEHDGAGFWVIGVQGPGMNLDPELTEEEKGERSAMILLGLPENLNSASAYKARWPMITGASDV